MAALTLADIKLLARDLLDEPGTTYFDDAMVTRQANVANRWVWRELVRANAEHFLSVTSITWPANTERINLPHSSYLSAEPYKVISVEETSSSGGVSSSNRPWQWLPIGFSERTTYHGRSNMTSGSIRSTAYCLHGDYMYAAPVPTDARNLTIYWVAHLSALSADGHEVLGGQAEAFGDHVGFCLAWILNAKQDGQNPVVTQLWSAAQKDIRGQAGKRQIQRPRGVVVRRDV